MHRAAMAESAPGPPASIWRRLGTAAVGVPAFVALVTQAPAWLFPVLVLGLGAVAARELARLFERAGHRTYPWLAVVAGAAVTAAFLVPGAAVAALTGAVAAALLAPVCAPGPPSAGATAIALLSLTYVSWLLGHVLLLHGLPDGIALVLFLVGVTWCGESAAWLVGSAVGRHQLAPVISPRKTVEGSLAHFGASVGTAALLGAWVLPERGTLVAAVAGALLGVTGQLGDLAESAIKRSVGAKDAGATFPGHGGVLDRLDGLLFNAPALYYYVTWVGGRS